MNRVLPCGVVLFMIWGCTHTATEPKLEVAAALGAQATAISVQDADGSGRVIEAVTGSGQLHTGTDGSWRTFTIHAVKAVDGSVDGSFQWRVHQGQTGSKIKGVVQCFSVEGNQAWLAVVFEKAENPANIGKWARIRVVDNGEGMASAADELAIRWSAFPGPGNDPEDFCMDQPTGPEVTPIEAGNIQIHQ
ncbi:MAG: hypothetical protein LJF04_14825 [Gemmatimonadetes bacterium]|nr:hypothetical protein [Gemmatimonadota bacterium]